MLKNLFTLPVFTSVLCVVACSAHAQIVGGDGLLTSTNLTTLQGYLGEDPLKLTNIFIKTPGDGETSFDFHAAADGKGRTFSIYEVLSVDGAPNFTPEVIGGYDPQSWDNHSGWHTSPYNSERTAFLFNLTKDFMQIQNGASNYIDLGVYQTINAPYYGPTFGESDIFTPYDLTNGVTENNSYGHPYGYNSRYNDSINILLNPTSSYIAAVKFGRIEVFSIAAGIASVPEPTSFSLIGSLLLLGGTIGWRQKNRNN